MVFTALLPTLYVYYLLRSGQISDFHINRREERYRPLAAVIVALSIATALLFFTEGPRQFLIFSMAILIEIVLFALVTLRWKISAHGMTASSFAVLSMLLLGWVAWPTLLLVPIVGWARIKLRRHTPAQVMAGVVLGATAVTVGFMLGRS